MSLIEAWKRQFQCPSSLYSIQEGRCNISAVTRCLYVCIVVIFAVFCNYWAPNVAMWYCNVVLHFMLLIKAMKQTQMIQSILPYEMESDLKQPCSKYALSFIQGGHFCWFWTIAAHCSSMDISSCGMANASKGGQTVDKAGHSLVHENRGLILVHLCSN